MAGYTGSFKISPNITTERKIFSFHITVQDSWPRMSHDCFWNINGIENGGSLLGAGDCGKDKSAANPRNTGEK